MHSHEGNRDIDIEQYSARLAVHMVVPLHPAVVAAGLVGESQFLDQPVLGKKVERAVDRAIPDMRVSTADTFKNLPGGEVRFRQTDDLEDCGALRCVLEPLTWHDSTFRHSTR